MNAMEGVTQKNKPLMVYNRRRRRRTKSLQQVGESPTTSSSNNAPQNQPETPLLSSSNNDDKNMSVYRRRGRRTATNVVQVEAEGLCVNSSDSPIACTPITEMHGRANNSSLKNNALGSKNNKRRLYAEGNGVKREAYELRSAVCRPVQSQLSTTADEVKIEVSTISDITEVCTNKLNHRLQNTKFGRKRHRKYLKFSTILKNTKSDHANSRHGKDPNVFTDDEDYMGDERKQKVTRTVESLYICPIVIGDFRVKSWHTDSCLGAFE